MAEVVGERWLAEAGAAALSCHRVHLRENGRVVLDGVTLDVRAGEVYALLGPGRRALARVACGLQEPDEGTVLLGGLPVRGFDAAARVRRAGYVAESVVVVPSATVAQTVALWARFLLVPGDRVPEVLHRTGLEARAHDRVDRSDAATLRELAVAVALLTRPALLVLDEPAGADPAGRVVETLARLAAGGTAVLYAAERLADTCGIATRAGSLVAGSLVAGSLRPERPLVPTASSVA